MAGKKKIRKYLFHEWDYALILVSLALSLFGIVMAFSASYYSAISKQGNPYYFLKNNLMWYAIGWTILIIFAHVDYHKLKQLAIPGIIIGVLLLVILLLPLPINKTINNATRWIGFDPIPVTIMPGEIIKPALILFFAFLFSRNKRAMRDWRYVYGSFALIGVIFLLILKQPNLSTACIVAMLGVSLMFVAGLSWIWVILGAGGAVGGLFFILNFTHGYMRRRIVTAFDPWADKLGDGYQVVQSLLALGSGGVKGVGFNRSIQKTLYLPEPQSDFILSIVGEELGFIGVLALFLLYAVLFARLISVALRAKDKFGCLLAFGTASLLALHVILNVLVITATFPPTGVFLPFVSQGGNATLVFLSLIGITLNVSRQAYIEETDEEKAQMAVETMDEDEVEEEILKINSDDTKSKAGEE